MSAPGWKEALSDYVSEIAFGEFMLLDTGHYVHYDKADVITVNSKVLLEEIE